MIFHFLPQMLSSHFLVRASNEAKMTFSYLQKYITTQQSRLLTSHSHRVSAPFPDWHCHYTFILNASAAPANSPFARTSSHALIISMKISLIFPGGILCVCEKSRALERSNEKSEKCTLFSLREGERENNTSSHTTLYAQQHRLGCSQNALTNESNASL